jgi:hypothetical protein
MDDNDLNLLRVDRLTIPDSVIVLAAPSGDNPKSG